MTPNCTNAHCQQALCAARVPEPQNIEPGTSHHQGEAQAAPALSLRRWEPHRIAMEHGHTTLVGGPADGVVPVQSAHHDHVENEIMVPATHRKLQAHPHTEREVAHILRRHADLSSSLVAPQISEYREEASSPALAAEDPT